MGINATLLGQIGTFVVFVLFCMKFVWPNIQQAMQDRRRKIAEGLAAAEDGKQELDRAKDEAKGIVREAQDKASTIVEQANQRAAKIVDDAKQDAQAERQRQTEAARHEIEVERNNAREALREQVAVLAVSGASQILQREVDAKAHEDVLNRIAAEL